MNQIEIRIAILEDLYNQAINKGRMDVMISQELLDKFSLNNIDDNFLIFNLLYLEDKGFIEVYWGMQRKIFGIKITSLGCDIVEFYKLGLSFNSLNKESKFETVLKQILNSGNEIIKNSAISLINLYLSKFIS
ncbi:hypothetical protein SAMN02745135_01136 [Caloranaerobacter azorensis DSM 13643]|uniref:YjcQ protein n=1 Tax=Caloranaerobacter azorensis DSM 13643 TaxID=1121264 RepID=A0A1M5TU97_9FIRM|nr:hypothetical protein [Caloranaerobacter azorensis]SHH54269.1 hypothetical protein SAMN02745135_01136 [Caloranaerobacter azorensis DSM 13643]